MSLQPDQVNALLNGIGKHRVFQAQGHSHVPAYDITAHLTRVFGFGGWDKEILSLDIVHERSTAPTVNPKDGKPTDQGRWWVTYACRMRLTVKDPAGSVVGVYEDAATGSAQNMPSPADAYDFAIKNAVSYALKRCAKDLGDQFGLSLYNKGMTDALVRNTLVRPLAASITAQAAANSPVDLQEGIPVPASVGNDELQWADDDPERPFVAPSEQEAAQ